MCIDEGGDVKSILLYQLFTQGYNVVKYRMTVRLEYLTIMLNKLRCHDQL